MKTTQLLLLAGLMGLSFTASQAATCTRMGDTTYCDDDYGNTRVVGGYGDTVYVDEDGPSGSRLVSASRYGDTVQVDETYGSNTYSTTYGSYGDTDYRDDGDEVPVW